MNNNNINKWLFDFIGASPTAFHSVANAAKMLEAAGFSELCESGEWQLSAGEGYYVTRNGSSLIAFRFPEGDFNGYMMTAAHGDSPAFRIKENALLDGKDYVRFSTEKYGGMLCSSWMDRPLSVAGRITVRTADGIEIKNVDLREPVAIIPNVAIHMNRNANDGASFNAAVDMLPLYCLGGDGTETLRARVAAAAGVDEKDILTTDLSVYNTQAGVEWGTLISAPGGRGVERPALCPEARRPAVRLLRSHGVFGRRGERGHPGLLPFRQRGSRQPDKAGRGIHLPFRRA